MVLTLKFGAFIMAEKLNTSASANIQLQGHGPRAFPSEDPSGIDLHTEPESPKAGVIASTSRRRKRSVGKFPKPLKRPRLSDFCEEYRQLLNEEIQDVSIRLGQQVPESLSLQAGQIGASMWSSLEKETLFNALASLGKDDVRGIAFRIKTKSALEVASYLQLLEKGSVEKYLNDRRPQLLGPMDMPAALEIDEECISALEAPAHALREQQEYQGAIVERQKWGDYWLLTSGTAEWVETKLAEGESGLREVVDVVPAAAILNLETWLELSERVFMNPGSPREGDNWRELTQDGEPPSIRHTAFADFSTLAVSLTKRLVQASLFFAMSRCRARASSDFHREYSVRAKDIHAACDALVVKRDSRRFWIHSPRRCGIHVYKRISDLTNESNPSPPMAYEEVERELSDKKTKSTSKANAAAESAKTIRSTSEEQLSANSETSDGDSDDGLLHGATYSKKRRELQKAQDDYMEASDLKASLAEEQRLWAILGKEPPSEIRKASIILPAKPVQERKEAFELLNWRDSFEYRAEWETCKTTDSGDNPKVSDTNSGIVPEQEADTEAAIATAAATASSRGDDAAQSGSPGSLPSLSDFSDRSNDTASTAGDFEDGNNETSESGYETESSNDERSSADERNGFVSSSSPPVA